MIIVACTSMDKIIVDIYVGNSWKQIVYKLETISLKNNLNASNEVLFSFHVWAVQSYNNILMYDTFIRIRFCVTWLLKNGLIIIVIVFQIESPFYKLIIAKNKDNFE